eukprot:c1881_g1_i1.p1 GENE.c1881_g1_i1~~c1881_g1_i1.p1  ORF type:complete len:105 (+),score=21.79 c1881_g1_i1:229-543(+)
MDAANAEVAIVWKNETAIEGEIKLLSIESKKFSKQISQWLNVYNSFNDALKEVGDVENWLGAIEADMKIVTEAVVLASSESRTARERELELEKVRLETIARATT